MSLSHVVLSQYSLRFMWCYPHLSTHKWMQSLFRSDTSSAVVSYDPAYLVWGLWCLTLLPSVYCCSAYRFRVNDDDSQLRLHMHELDIQELKTVGGTNLVRLETFLLTASTVACALLSPVPCDHWPGLLLLSATTTTSDKLEEQWPVNCSVSSASLFSAPTSVRDCSFCSQAIWISFRS